MRGSAQAGKPAEKRAVLLLAHGTPDSLDEIPQYLLNVTGGRPLPAAAIEEIRRRYSLIGKSPLTQLTLAQGQLLSRTLDLPVYVGMRNWKPYIADVVAGMRADGVTSAVVICLAPQNSRTSVGLYRRAVFAQAPQSIAMDFVEEWAGRSAARPGFRGAAQAALAERFYKNRPRRARAFYRAQRSLATPFRPNPRLLHRRRRRPLPTPILQQAKRTAANVAALLAPLGFTASRLVLRLSEPRSFRRTQRN